MLYESLNILKKTNKIVQVHLSYPSAMTKSLELSYPWLHLTESTLCRFHIHNCYKHNISTPCDFSHDPTYMNTKY